MAAACPFSSHVTARDVLRFLTNFVSVAWATVRRPTAVLLCRVKVPRVPASARTELRLSASVHPAGQEERIRETIMPRGDKSKYTDKQERKAEHIEKGYEKRGVSKKEAKSRAWATVNKDDGGGKKPGGSGRGKTTGHPAAKKGGKAGARRRPPVRQPPGKPPPKRPQPPGNAAEVNAPGWRQRHTLPLQRKTRQIPASGV